MRPYEALEMMGLILLGLTLLGPILVYGARGHSEFMS